MFPIKDSIPARTTPYINWLLIGLNTLVFIYELSLGPRGMQMFWIDFGLVPAKLFLPLEAVGVFERFIPFFSSMFIHGGWFHFLFNMYFLFIFGDNIEDAFGHARYFFIYVFFGLAAAVTQVVLFPDAQVPTIGASGAVAGVMGAYFILYPHARVKTLVLIFFFITIVDIPAVVFLGLWFLLQFLSGTTSAAMQGGGGVAWWAHIGGFVAGLLFAIYHVSRKRWRYN